MRDARRGTWWGVQRVFDRPAFATYPFPAESTESIFNGVQAMENQPNPTQSTDSRQTCSVIESADGRLDALTSLFDNLDVGHQPRPSLSQYAPHEPFENRLVRARLGLTSSLFFALLAKHAPSAAHRVRVALVSSSWCTVLGFDAEQRDEVEVAALLHDIGRIGIPERLTAPENTQQSDGPNSRISRSQHARQILAGCCDSPTLLDAIYYAAAPYDGQCAGFDRQGDDLPLASRLLAIVNAFDELKNGQPDAPQLSRQ